MQWLSDQALEEPLTKKTPWEVLDEYRQELFKHMELITSFSHLSELLPLQDEIDFQFVDGLIQQVSDRLKIIARLTPKAARKAGAVEEWDSKRCSLCHQKLKR